MESSLYGFKKLKIFLLKKISKNQVELLKSEKIMPDTTLSFYFPDFSFCEGKLNGGPPEYINALSSIVMSLIGIYGLYFNKHNNIIFKS